jgi:hypothetical protein
MLKLLRLRLLSKVDAHRAHRHLDHRFSAYSLPLYSACY